MQEAIQYIRHLEEEAERCRRPEDAFNFYERALGICNECALSIGNSHTFNKTAAKIHCKQAGLAFKTDNMGIALQEADNSINRDPHYLEVN